MNRVTYASKVSDSDAQIIQQVKDIQNELNEKQSQQQQLLADQQTQQAELNDKVNEAQSYVSSLDQQVQDALAKEQAEREAQQEAERKAAEEKAAQENNYVSEGNANAGNTNSNANTNTNTNNGGGSSNSGNSGSNGSSGGSSLGSGARNTIISTAYSKIGWRLRLRCLRPQQLRLLRPRPGVLRRRRHLRAAQLRLARGLLQQARLPGRAGRHRVDPRPRGHLHRWRHHDRGHEPERGRHVRQPLELPARRLSGVAPSR